MNRFCPLLVILLALSVPVWAQHGEGKGEEHAQQTGGHKIRSTARKRPTLSPAPRLLNRSTVNLMASADTDTQLS